MKKRREIEILARGVCVRKGMLLVCRCKGESNTYLPGGHVEFGEGVEKALCREIREELGKRALAKRFLGCVEHTFAQRGERHVEVNLVFEVGIEGITVARDPASREDWIEFQWIRLSELKRSSLEPWSLRRQLPGWLRGRGATRWSTTLFARHPEKG